VENTNTTGLEHFKDSVEQRIMSGLLFNSYTDHLSEDLYFVRNY
jgi:hypothetical protein